MNSILSICKKVMKVTDDEVRLLRIVADEQRHYCHPLKNGTAAKQNALGQYNSDVLDLVVALRSLLLAGPGTVMLDFSGKPPPKCLHCGRPKSYHKAVTLGCPGGKRDRTHGFQWFSETQRFSHPSEPDERKEA